MVTSRRRDAATRGGTERTGDARRGPLEVSYAAWWVTPIDYNLPLGFFRGVPGD